MAQFTSDGLYLAYDEFGPQDARKAVVLVHGFSANKYENWKRMGWYDAIAAKGIRGLALDNRGHGESAKPHEPALGVRPEANSADASIKARRGLDALTPDQIRREPWSFADSEGQLITTPHYRIFTTIDEPMLKSFRHFTDEQKEDRLALAACSRRPRTPITPDMLMGMRRPTLVIAGMRDQLAGPPQGLADAIPGAKAVTVPGCDHFSLISHGLFKASVFDFFDGWLE